MTLRRRIGNIIIPGGMSPPEPHEFKTADVFARAGKDVEFIKPSRIKGAKTPDVKIEGVLWEIKSPTGNGKGTIEKQLRRAGRQSKNIIIDSRRTALEDEYLEREVCKQLPFFRTLKRSILVKKDEKILEIKRK